MPKPTLTVFANFCIDSRESLQRMKDSYLSFRQIDAQKWVVNIRGAFQNEARSFLEENLGTRLVMFQMQSREGWFFDSRIMLREISSDFVLIWIEDHISMVQDCDIYDEILKEMQLSKVEFLPYSFFWSTKRYDDIKRHEMKTISWMDLDIHNFELLQRRAPKAYIIHLLGIFDFKLFNKIVQDDDYRQTIKWPKETPFNFEKSWHDVHWLPIRIGLPKQELFASIDDDSSQPGSCLISRGLYSPSHPRKIMGMSDSIRPLHKDSLSYLNQRRDPQELIRRLRHLNIGVDNICLDFNEFRNWIDQHVEMFNHYQKMGGVCIEKCLEHFLADKLTELRPGQAYIDVAAAGSNWADCLQKKGIAAYSLDLKYPKGTHGNKIGANAAATRLPDNCVDAMSLQCSFETFIGDNDRLFIRECRRILKDGGKVVISPLYLDMQHFILSACNTDLANAPLDDGAIRVWREDEYEEAFSRHYSPESLANRIFSQIDGLSAQVIYISNLDQIRRRFPGQRIYCDFILLITKQPPKAENDQADCSGRLYDEKFYEKQQGGSCKSAEVIVPIILEVFDAKSVIDIGCGVGAWLHHFQKCGVTEIYGYDANDLPAPKYFIDKKHIKANSNIASQDFKIAEKSDLLICLEVAEHLPADVSDHFLKNLCCASPVIIFSAALPGQTGVNHINEQPPWYWRNKFNKLGYIEIDFLRSRILHNTQVSWWYRQNITCFARPEAVVHNQKLAALAKIHKQDNNVHKLTIVNEWVLDHILNGKHLESFTNAFQKDQTPLLSVIIPTRNRAEQLFGTLESLTLQTYPQNRFEVLVVDNGSTDATADVCEHFKLRIQKLRYIYEPRPGLHNGRHAGLKHADGQILVYADDDIEAQPTWLEGIAESFADSAVALVGGKILPKFDGKPPAWVAALCRNTTTGWVLGWYSVLDFGDLAHEISPEYVWGCNFSIRKDVLTEIGGFHPDGFPRELIKYRGDGETYVSESVRKLGLKALYNPRAAVHHLVPASRMTPEYLYQRTFNQGISNSFSEIRKRRSFAAPMKYAPASNTIHDTVDRGMVDGFNYHQQMVKSDSILQEWVLKENYL
jgi:glucosyl-dolichyl phosphate glucuronosyltransferase